MSKIQDVITSMFHFEEQSVAPGTPDAGVVVIYAKSDGKLYGKGDDGTEFPLDSTDMAKSQSGAAPPAATISNAGHFYRVDGGAGVADILKVCVKKADDTYDWLIINLT